MKPFVKTRMIEALHACLKPAFCVITLVIFLSFLNKISAQAPVNDNCANAVVLTPSSPGVGCTTTNGTLANASNSGIPIGSAASCTGNPDDDVWYRFTSTSTDHTITLSNLGTNITGTGGGSRLELYSGTCGALTSITCGNTSINITTLARNRTYYIRVFTRNSTVLTTNATFRICVSTPADPTLLIDFGKSYINLNKPNSGTVETGDTLEIRASVAVRGGAYDSCRFTDNVPTGTSYVPGTLRILTNEGKTFRQFTDAQFDASNDQGWISGTAITMNLGYNATDNPATISSRGRIRNNNGHKPSVWTSACLMMATYRVVVTASLGSIINTGGGSMTYTAAPPTVSTFTFPSNPVAVYTNYGMCSNSVGTNSIGTEFNGSFGSGALQNRGTSVNVPIGYTYAPFSASGPNDYYYGIANNTCNPANYTTSNSWAKPDNSSPTHRVFNVWDIIGDHTGATNPILGNPATDNNAVGANGGYMLIVNAAYRIDSAFQQTISNLCPNTYYEISCWMRNICSKCGCDSNGVGNSGTGYIPSGPGDSSGVQPNVTFEVDNIDYYSTGNIPYTGQWVKRGFVYKTGPSQTSFVLKFFNNAPGGGGNDWALDDITVGTCLPNMSYSPTITPNVCRGNALTIYDTVRSYFNNYTEYKWQRSTNNGLSWADVTSPTTATPVLTGGTYQFISSYTIPVANTNAADSGNLYRLVVATTTANLSDANCRSTDPTTIVTLNTLDCTPVLDVKLISFNGNLSNQRATLQWVTSDENSVSYDIEKSLDGINFFSIGTINGYGNNRNFYYYNDPSVIVSKVYYRLKVKTRDNKSFYSRTLLLSENAKEFSFASVINPFRYTLSFDISSAKAGPAAAELVNSSGITLRKKTLDVREGISQFNFDNVQSLAAGMYVLRVEMNGAVIYKTVVKQN